MLYISLFHSYFVHLANAAIGDFNTVPYPRSRSLGGPGYLRFNASDGNETAEICVDVNYDDCNEHEQEDFTLHLIPRADHDVMIGENNMLTVNIPISASQTNQKTQAGVSNAFFTPNYM